MGRKHRIDLGLALAVIGLMFVGSVVIFAVGPRVAQASNSLELTNYSDNHFITNHLIFIAMSLVVMFVMSRDWRPIIEKITKREMSWKYNFDLLERHALKLLIVAAVLCFLIPIIGRLTNDTGQIGSLTLVTCDEGACRAFRIPGLGIGFQAVEFFKLAVLIYMASIIAKRKADGKFEQQEFWIPIGVVLAVTGIAVCWLMKDLGSTVVIFAMVAVMLLMSGVKMKNMMKLLLVVIIAAIPLIVFFPHRVERILNWQGGEDSDRYHIEAALMGISTGGVTGVGIGNSIQSTGYLPETISDSIFAVICEVAGFLGAMVVMVLYAVIFVRLIRIARRTKPLAWRLVILGVFAWIFAHVIINVLGMLDLIPMKGITLSFLSFGGTSMLFSSIAIGLALQISTWTEREVVNEDTSSRRGEWGTRNAGYRRRS